MPARLFIGDRVADNEQIVHFAREGLFLLDWGRRGQGILNSTRTPSLEQFARDSYSNIRKAFEGLRRLTGEVGEVWEERI